MAEGGEKGESVCPGGRAASPCDPRDLGSCFPAQAASCIDAETLSPPPRRSRLPCPQGFGEAIRRAAEAPSPATQGSTPQCPGSESPAPPPPPHPPRARRRGRPTLQPWGPPRPRDCGLGPSPGPGSAKPPAAPAQFPKAARSSVHRGLRRPPAWPPAPGPGRPARCRARPPPARLLPRGAARSLRARAVPAVPAAGRSAGGRTARGGGRAGAPARAGAGARARARAPPAGRPASAQ